jgi:hypothetical protein
MVTPWKKKFAEWYFAFLIVFVFSFMVVALCGVLEDPKKGLASAEAASWVQAFGSIGAIGGAFLIAQSQHKKERVVEIDRRLAEQVSNENTELMMRTLAAKNMVQIATQALDVMRHVLIQKRNNLAADVMDLEQSRIDQLRTILDSFATPNTNHIALVAALEIGRRLTQTQADLPQLGGGMTESILTKIHHRIDDSQAFLDRLISLQNKLEDKCRARGLPLESDDFV